MSKTQQKIELLANISIILVALLLGGVIVQKYFFAPAPQMAANQPPRLEPKVGTKVEALDENWSQQPKTLVLALQTSCHFCNDSAPFYKRVVESVRGKNVKLVAVFPTKVDEGVAHLNELGLGGAMEVKQSSLGSLQVSGTPTLILTNSSGEITDYWVGKLSTDKETEVINKLNS